MKNKKLFLLLIITTAISVSIYFYKNKNQHHNFKHKNVLLLSFCSVNANSLPIFNSNISTSKYPNLSKVFKTSYIYTNSFGNTSWQNIMPYIFTTEWMYKFTTHEEKNRPKLDWFSDGVNISFNRIPGEKDTLAGYREYFNSDRSLYPFDHIEEIISYINNIVAKPNSRNVIMLHFKLMHYPYLSNDLYEDKNLINKKFSQNEIQLLNKYFQNPELYPDKLSFFQIMFGDVKFQKLYFNKNHQYLAYAIEPKSIEKWKMSKNYETDKLMLQKAYEIRLEKFDQLIGKLLDYYSKIEKDTALILTGDHGETLGKHDYLSHGTTPYDDVIRFFFSVHFPYQTKNEIYSRQTSQKTIGKLIEDIAIGNVNEINILKKQPTDPQDNYLMSFSCAGDVASIRLENKWKLIYFFKEDQFHLFDLAKDPDELIDVADSNIEMAMSLKTAVVDYLSKRKFSTTSCTK